MSLKDDTQNEPNKTTFLTLLNQLGTTDDVIRQLHKIDSKMLAGQFIPAYRDLRSLLAFFEQHKKNILAEQTNTEFKQVNLPTD